MHRSFWILMTFVTRPMIWILGVTMILAGIFLSGIGNINVFGLSTEYQNVDAGILKTTTPIRSTQQLGQSVSTPTASGYEIDWSALAHQQVDELISRPDSGARHIDEQTHDIVNRRLNQMAMPDNTVALHTRGWGVDQAVVDRIGELTTLRRLGFLFGYGDQPPDLSPLANLKQLQVLDLGVGSHATSSLTPLQELPHLKTLSLGSHQWVNKERMAEIARLPALATLYLPDISQNQRAMAALSELRKSTSLKKIHISIPMDSPQKIASVQARVPEMQVASSQYLLARLWTLIGAVWACLVFSSLGIHFGGQFSLPLAQLAPNYQSAHQRVAWVMVAAIIAVLTLVVCQFGANWLAVSSIVGLCLITGIGDNIAAQRTFGKSRGWRRLSALIGVLVFTSLIVLAFARPMVIEEYAMGRSIFIPILFISISLLIAFRTGKSLNPLCRDRIEAGRPLMLSMHDIQRASIDLQQRRLTSTPDTEESTELEPYARQGPLVTIFGYIALAAAIILMVFPAPLYGIGVQQYLGMLCCFLAFWSLFVVGVKWWQRMPYLSSMMTRPPRRAVQIDRLFQGVRSDLVRLLPVAVAVGLVITHAEFFSPDNVVVRLLVSGLLVASVAIICYAAIIWTLMIRSVWGVGILCFGIYFGVSMLAASLTMIGWSGQGTLPTYRVVITTIVIALVAIAAVTVARRQFRRVEWARFM